MKLADVLGVLQEIAPEHLAESWDQVGLHLAGSGKAIRRALLCIDLTPQVVDEAVAKKCQLVVSYHPPIFRPVARLADRDWKERLLARAVRAGLAVYSPHTSLDAVRNGMNDWFCDGLGAHRLRRSIGAPSEFKPSQCKLVVYVPRAAADTVRNAMWGAGAGGIARYTHCSFNVDGIGTFKGSQDTNPAVGDPGRFETVEEARIEMLCHKDRLGGVVQAIRTAHPYEEAAIDILEQWDEPQPEGEQQTPGRYMHLRRPISAEVLVKRVKQRLGIKRLKIAVPSEYGDQFPGQIESLAVCVGSGGSLFEKCTTADAYITGEMQHHQVLDMVQERKVVILAGHTNTERPFLANYRDVLVDKCGTVDWALSEKDVAPLQVV